MCQGAGFNIRDFQTSLSSSGVCVLGVGSWGGRIVLRVALHALDKFLSVCLNCTPLQPRGSMDGV